MQQNDWDLGAAEMPAVIMSAEHSMDHDSMDAPSPASTDSGSKKRSTASAGLDSNGNPKPVKRRAAKACAACRARKVRCDVMQRYHVTADGEITCSNCTMDGIKCVIEESKRRKKHLSGQLATPAPSQAPAMNGAQAWRNGLVNPTDIANLEARRWSGSTAMSNDINGNDFSEPHHVPHSIYQNINTKLKQGDLLRRQSFVKQQFEDPAYALLTSAAINGDLKATRLQSPPAPPAPLPKYNLPGYIKPLPQRITSIDTDYLFAKGALTLPEVPIRNALLRAYIEFVHPYMPLIEVHELLRIIQDTSGGSGKLSLLLFQAIMFAGTAFVDMDYLKAAGFSNRKAARKAFFQKARVLYDFDYEIDRVSLVQSLLLMTYWYETPDDQKDTWHWMGVAISLAHTIGLHRDPENSNMEPSKKKLWKRIWWSCFMRDRLVALGMRRPTRVKDEDYDVPMLTEDDFEIAPLADNITIISQDCTVIRDVKAQRELAQMCIAKAKLCLCISHVLSAQYSVLVRHQGMQGREGSTRSSVMLFPKKIDQSDEVNSCDVELSTWINELPASCQYSDDLGATSSPVFVQRSLLHMVYYTTLSALHRPQVLPSGASTATSPTEIDRTRELQDLSRKKVREASKEITRMSQDLHTRGLEKYLPTTGVTVLLPAIIIHLLDIKSCNDEARHAAMDGFSQCMLVLEKLRDSYASADFAMLFLEAAIRKADIDIVVSSSTAKAKEEKEAFEKINNLREWNSRAGRHTPPLSSTEEQERIFKHGYHQEQHQNVFDDMDDITVDNGQQQPATNPIHNTISARTPPSPDTTHHDQHFNLDGMDFHIPSGNGQDSAVDLNDFLNFDNGDWNALPLENGAHGESGGFMGDMNWIDHDAPRWSRLGTPTREGDIFGTGLEAGKIEV